METWISPHTFQDTLLLSLHNRNSDGVSADFTRKHIWIASYCKHVIEIFLKKFSMNSKFPWSCPIKMSTYYYNYYNQLLYGSPHILRSPLRKMRWIFCISFELILLHNYETGSFVETQNGISLMEQHVLNLPHSLITFSSHPKFIAFYVHCSVNWFTFLLTYNVSRVAHMCI